MRLPTIDVDRIKQNVDLRQLAEPRTTLHSASGQRELCGPCPKCGGTKRFHVAAEWFFCRDCHPKRGDAVEFVCWLNGVDFKEACTQLAGGNVPITSPKVAPDPKQADKPSVDWQSPEWQHKATGIVRFGHDMLVSWSSSQPGREYLIGRGLGPDTWKAFQLGYKSDAPLPGTGGKQRRPAIVIPWYRDGKLCAVRYRFLEYHKYTDAKGNERKEKQSAISASSFSGVLFGEYALGTSAGHDETLVICEGELNAVSIWQASRGRNIDVLSLGSESARLSPEAIERASKYEHVLAWLDKRERAQEIMKSLPGAYGVQSPRGKDANDWLQAGKLEDLLIGFLKRMGWKPEETPPPMQPYEKMLALSDQLGFTWERLEDGRIWLSRWDDELFRAARALIRQMDNGEAIV